MAAEIQYKKINEFVSACTALTNVTGAFLYGIDSNGNSVKIAVANIVGENYDAQITELTNKCNGNAANIESLQNALRGKAAAQHTHSITDVSGLRAELDGKAAERHTHEISDIDGLDERLQALEDEAEGSGSDIDALSGRITANANSISNLQSSVSSLNSSMTAAESDIQTLQSDMTAANDAISANAESISDLQTGKAAAQHTHRISDVANLSDTLTDHERRIEVLENNEGGGGTSDALKQRDLSEYTGEDDEIVMHKGATTARLVNGYTYKCSFGATVKTITQGMRYVSLMQDGVEYISDMSVDASTTKMLSYYTPEVDGITYTVFTPPTLPTEEQSKLVGCYVPDSDGGVHQISSISASGTTINSVTLENGVILPISGTQHTSQAIYTFYAKNGEEYAAAGQYSLLSKDFAANASETQYYPLATAPIGTAFGASTQMITATADIVIRSQSWTQSNSQPPTGVASGDNFLTITNNELGASIDIAYNSSNQHLELKGKNSSVVSYVDMGVFIKDGMLDDALLYTTAEPGVTVEVPYLKFIFNVASGKSVIRVSLKDLVDIYDGANINLTSAFVKATQYSAPAIGDSMDVAIGKLLKGHEDNAAAISGKQDTLTFDDAPTTGSNHVVKSGGIKAAIDAAVGNVPNALKQKDLTTYQGTDGEIVQHTGATTAEFVNGYVYKFKAGEIIIPANTLFIKAITGGRRFGSTDAEVAERIATYKLPFVHQGKKLIYESYANGMQVYFPDGEPKVGDPAVWGTGYVRHVTSVSAEKIIVDDYYEFPNSFAERDYYTDGNGVEIYTTFNAAYSLDGDLDSQQAYYELGTEWGAYQVTFTFSKSKSTTTFDEWQRINVQPSSEGAVFDLETRMAAAETVISGKVDKVTGKGLSTNDYTDTEKNKLAGIDANANNYSLPAAAANTLGGVKVGTNLSIDGNGVLSATDTKYTPQSLGFGHILCTTAESTLEKTATLSGWTLTNNAIITVRFSYNVPADSTLNINSSGAKQIWYNGAALPSGIIKGTDEVTFIYDGTRFRLIAIDKVNPERLSSVVPISKGGTGATMVREARYNLFDYIAQDSSDFIDTNKLIISYATPTANNGAIYNRSVLTFWNYIKSKIFGSTLPNDAAILQYDATNNLVKGIAIQPLATADAQHQGIAEASDVKDALENAGIIWTEL